MIHTSAHNTQENIMQRKISVGNSTTSTPEMADVLKALRDMKNNCEQLADMLNHISPRKVRAEDFTEPADLIFQSYKNK